MLDRHRRDECVIDRFAGDPRVGQLDHSSATRPGPRKRECGKLAASSRPTARGVRREPEAGATSERNTSRTPRGRPGRGAGRRLRRTPRRRATSRDWEPVSHRHGDLAARIVHIAISRTTKAGRLPSVAAKQPFENVVEVYGSTVLRVCRAVVGPTDADDAWSETFLSAMKAYPDLPGDANVEAWLVTIAHRKAIDVVRAAARRAIPSDDMPAIAATPSAELDMELTEALARLPTKQKQAVAYHYLGGLPYADVAAILGGSTGAARRAAADGIASLRRTYVGASAGQGEPR